MIGTLAVAFAEPMEADARVAGVIMMILVVYVCMIWFTICSIPYGKQCVCGCVDKEKDKCKKSCGCGKSSGGVLSGGSSSGSGSKKGFMGIV